MVSGTPDTWVEATTVAVAGLTLALSVVAMVLALAEVARVAPRPPSMARDRTGTPILVSRDLVFICETTSFFRKGPGLSRARAPHDPPAR